MAGQDNRLSCWQKTRLLELGLISSASYLPPMRLEILSVNIAKIETINTKSGQTGIFKRSQTGTVHVGPVGLESDAIVDLANHGGTDQAVYIYCRDDYIWWERQLGRPLEPGEFGENLTIAGLESAAVMVGDRFRIGPVLLEATSPRIPCNTFAVRMGDPHFVKRFMAAKRPGIYCRVLQTGAIAAGAEAEIIPFAGQKVSILELFEKYPFATVTQQDRQRYLSAPIHGKLAAYLRGENTKP